MPKTNKELTVELAATLLEKVGGLDTLNDLSPAELASLLKKLYDAIAQLPDA